MSCLTKLFYHTGTTSPTDIGPASGGVLHSVYSIGATGPTIIRDGGSGGTIIAKLGLGLAQIQWEGVRLDGQLNITLGDSSASIIVEMSEVL